MADHVCTTVAQLNTALAAAVAGDRILVRGAGHGGAEGYYQTTNAGSGEVRINGGFTFANSGTSGNPITLMGYPGDATPTLANRASGNTSYIAFPTITTGGHSYITIKNLKVDGAIFVFQTGYSMSGTTLIGGATGCRVESCEIWEGWESQSDGNWAGIRLEGQTLTAVRNCYIHDINALGHVLPGSSSTCGIKLFTAINTTNEYNSIKDVLFETDAGGVDDKATSINNDHRYIWTDGVTNGHRIQNQAGPGSPAAATGTRFRQCVVILNDENGRAFTQEEGPIGDYELSNVVAVLVEGSVVPGSDDGLIYAANSGSGQNGAKVFNNILLGTTAYRNQSNYALCFGGGGLCNYNHYSVPNKQWRYGSNNYATLAAWQGIPLDANASSGTIGFVNAAGEDFHLDAGSACINTGYSNGTGSGGSSCDKGAYAFGITAIGHGAIAPENLRLGV